MRAENQDLVAADRAARCHGLSPCRPSKTASATSGKRRAVPTTAIVIAQVRTDATERRTALRGLQSLRGRQGRNHDCLQGPLLEEWLVAQPFEEVLRCNQKSVEVFRRSSQVQ
jgi:hypothetical protein